MHITPRKRTIREASAKERCHALSVREKMLSEHYFRTAQSLMLDVQISDDGMQIPFRFKIEIICNVGWFACIPLYLKFDV